MSARINVLVACEFSGVVRNAFNAYAGVNAISCDLLPAEDGRVDVHQQGDVRPMLQRARWDLVIAHPPCTFLANSGARWLYHPDGTKNIDRWEQMRMACVFFMDMLAANAQHVAVENPVIHGHAQAIVGKPDQVIQPWMFGHGEIKATCLWLRNLPRLTPSKVVEGRHPRVHSMPPGPNRWKERSRTYSGIADAMAAQWIPVIQAAR